MQRYDHFIAGESVAPASGVWFDTKNPFTGEAWAHVARGDARDVDRAVQAAHAALTTGAWAGMTATQRGLLLHRLGDLLARDAEKLAHIETRDNGKLLVFFNACEVGATAAASGEVGGWADAFLARRFRAFIAPLWAVDEEDAAVVSAELIAKLVQEKMPIGTALSEIRAAHGKTSSTFYSYLVYGDVTACFDTDVTPSPPALVEASP